MCECEIDPRGTGTHWSPLVSHERHWCHTNATGVTRTPLVSHERHWRAARVWQDFVTIAFVETTKNMRFVEIVLRRQKTCAARAWRSSMDDRYSFVLRSLPPT